jgi:hypothetical protein
MAALNQVDKQHQDVDIPLSLRSQVGNLLGDFERFMIAAGFSTTRVDKQGSGHVTPWWLHVVFDERRPAKSRCQFGETTHASVNRIPHLWCRGKWEYSDQAFNALQHFIQHAAYSAQDLSYVQYCRYRDMHDNIWFASEAGEDHYFFEATAAASGFSAFVDAVGRKWWCNEGMQIWFYELNGVSAAL